MKSIQYLYLLLIILFIPVYYSISRDELIFTDSQLNNYSLFTFNYKNLKIDLFRNYNTSSFALYNYPPSYKNCKLCTFQPNISQTTPNSSNRDAILTIGMGKLLNLLLFVKTLRTTGSKCRFIVFLDDEAMHHYDRNFYTTAENCGVEFVNFDRLKRYLDIACLRFRIYLDFLLINRNLFDRVYLCDMFDTAVQHDPFTTDFGDSLYLCDEGIKIKDDSINTYWISKCISDMEANSNDKSFIFSEEIKKNIFEKNILNSGLVAGSIDNMIKYCEAMSKMIDNSTFNLNAFYDQGFHNLIVHSGYLKGKVNYTIEKVNSELFASIGIYITRTDNIEHNDKIIDFGNIKRDDAFPGILHQFERSLKIKDSLLHYCPNKENFSDYIRNGK